MAFYASADGVAIDGAPISKKRVRPRAGRTARVALDAKLPAGAAGRFVVARVDDADEIAESDETNNVAAFGPFSTGEEYAPLETGNAWRYAGALTQNGGQARDYVNAIDVRGPHVVGPGVVAQAVASSDSRGSGTATVEYLQLDERGVVDWGDDDPTDAITAAIVPFRAFLLPFAAPYAFTSVARSGLPSGEDYDGDGRQDRFDASQRVRFVGFEDVDLPVAKFSQCAHLRTRAVATLLLSRSGVRIRVVGTQDQWLAPGVGPVHVVEDIKGPGSKQRTEETVTGAATASGGCGVVDGLAFASISIPATAPYEAPPAAASDGSSVLIATVRAPEAGDPHGLIGVVVSSTGLPLREFQIADVPIVGYDAPTPSVAFGAGEFVVAYRRSGEPLHLRAVTADGSFPWGADALDVPVATGMEGAFRVVFDGSGFLVFFEGDALPSLAPSVAVARVGAAGTLLGVSGASDTFASDGGVAAAWDGSNALCVWSDDGSLRAVRVAASGEILDATPIQFGTEPDVKSHPSVAAAPPADGWSRGRTR